MAILRFNEFRVNEGLIYSYPVDKAIQILQAFCDKYFNANISIKNQVDKNNESYNVILIEKFFKLNQNVNTNAIIEIDNTLQKLGYFVSLYRVMIDDGDFLQDFKELNNLLKFINDCKVSIQSIRITCEPKYDNTYNNSNTLRNNVNAKDCDIVVPDKLYHVAPMRYLNDIFRYGLLPSSKSKKGYHPHRIYVSENIDESIKVYYKILESDFEQSNIEYSNNPKYLFNGFTKTDILNVESHYYDYTILEIDCTKLKDYIKLHRDVNYESGYFFYEVIKPIFIKEIK